MRSAPEARAAACGLLFVGVKEPFPGIDFYPNCFSKLDLIGAHIIPSFSNETSMHQLKDRHGLTVSLVLSLTVYVQFPLLALDFRHGIQNESSSQREGGNKHERHG